MYELKSVGILRCAVIFAVMAAIGGFVEGLFFAAAASMAPAGNNGFPEMMKPFLGIGALIFFPIIGIIAGFIEGVIAAFLYNLVARWTGGFQFTVVAAAEQNRLIPTVE
jgi:hypothetical protein